MVYQFVYEIISIMLGIIWKPVYFSSNWYIICYELMIARQKRKQSDYIRRNVNK